MDMRSKRLVLVAHWSAAILICQVACAQEGCVVRYRPKIEFKWSGLLSIGIEMRQFEIISASDPDQQMTMPEEFQSITAEHRDYIDKLLDVWEANNKEINRLSCNFTRWDFDATIVNRRDSTDNQLIAHRIVKGQICFLDPNKFELASTQVWQFQHPNAQNPYVLHDGERDLEHWVFRSDKIIQFDFVDKRLFETGVPPEIRAKGEVECPIPLLFGIRRQQILDRYWLRTATPAGVNGEIWIVAVPKLKSEAEEYSKIEIILDLASCFPKSLRMYSTNYDATTDVKSAYEFENPKTNEQLDDLPDFADQFDNPKLEIGWKRVDGNPPK